MKYTYEMDVTVLVKTTRGYYPEQPIKVVGSFETDGPIDRAKAEADLVNSALDTFDAETPGYTRNELLYKVDNKRWSLITGGKVTRFEVTEAGQ